VQEFKSEDYLQKIINRDDPANQLETIMFAHHSTTGGFVSGKIKRAIMIMGIRLLISGWQENNPHQLEK
jgi:hypothetical protein